MIELQFKRLLSDPDASAAESRAAWDAYHDFLRSSDQSTSGDLLEFFGQNFFHDSGMANARFGASQGTFSFRGESWWVQDLDGETIYPAPEFDVRFQQVVAFDWRQTSVHHQRLFIDGEIDGLPGSIALAEEVHGGRFHSLAIDAFGEAFELVFRSVRVTPRDPERWALLLRDPNVKVLGRFKP